MMGWQKMFGNIGHALGMANNAIKSVPKSDDQFNNLNGLFTFEQKLFGSHTSSAKPEQHINVSTGGGEGDWVFEFTDTKGIPNLATIAIKVDNYLSGSIRYPSGTPANYIQGDSEYYCGPNKETIEVFQKDNVYTAATNQFALRGITDKFPISSFAEYAALLPNAQIHMCPNVYTQTVENCIASIDKFKAAVGLNRVVYWEMGNEVDGSAYWGYATDLAEPGSFPNLTGDDLTLAKSIFPEQRFDGSAYARYVVRVCAHIRANYPNDKIGLTSDYIGRWNTTAGHPGFIPAVFADASQWAQFCQRMISDDNYDAVIMHPYINIASELSWDDMATRPLPAAGKELDISFTDQEDKNWRYHAAVAQEFMKHLMNDKNQLWPKTKELWLTEWGCLTNVDAVNDAIGGESTTTGQVLNKLIDSTKTFITSGLVEVGDWVVNKTDWNKTSITAIDAEGQLSIADDNFTTGESYGIFTKNQPANMSFFSGWGQWWFRLLYVASHLISICEENVKWRGLGGPTTSLFHALVRGNGYSNQFFLTGYLNANGIAFSFFAKAVQGMTHMAIPILNDAAFTFPGIAQYIDTPVHPVRAIYFEDGSIQRLLLINVSPNARTVAHFFEDYSYWQLNEGSTPPNPYSNIAKDTYADMSDMTTGVNNVNSHVLQPFSIYLFEKTGGYESIDQFVLTIT